MFVSDTISSQDSMIGVSLSGPSGMLLTECIEKAGYKRSDVYTTTLLKCLINGLIEEK